ncbi:hypothetical protein [Microlunatus phosphovorus]|uniref:hypothetical protein n=1 Tax=Microlunatus phosphovorus TaxID=29405 RepID=UPI0012EA4D62|nr:hypothetical protein [Microlunatus phosphovorus]
MLIGDLPKGSGGNQRLHAAVFDEQTWPQPQPGPGGSIHGAALASTQHGGRSDGVQGTHQRHPAITYVSFANL